MTGNSNKNFDCIKFVRQVRREMYEETKHMTNDELDEYWQEFRERDPLLKRWIAHEASKKQTNGPIGEPARSGYRV